MGQSPNEELMSPQLKKWTRNKGSLVSFLLLIIICLAALFAPWIAPHAPEHIFAGMQSLPPVWIEGSDPRFLLGTDDLGRDLLSRLIFGTRVSLGVGLFVVLLSGSVGVLLGVVAGFWGGWIDALIMRLVDILMSLPSLLLALVVVAILGPGLNHAILAVGVVSLPGFIRIVRASVLNEKSKLYVLAAESYGVRDTRMILKHVLPNCMAPLLVQASLTFSDGILNVAALGFLGLGAEAPTPEWGVMLADAKSYLSTAWWMVTWPGLAILIVVLTFNILSDGLRDALDPKLRSAS